MPKAYKCERLHPKDEGVFLGLRKDIQREWKAV